MGSWYLLLIMIKEDIFMLSFKIELMKNVNEIKECLGVLVLKKKEFLFLGIWNMIEIIFKFLIECFKDIFGF